MLRDLRQFLDRLRQEGELVEVPAPCDPHLEIAEIHRRVIAAQGPALLFSNPVGHRMPVVTNLFGTRRRVGLAFGPRPEAFVQQAVRLVTELMPPTAGGLWRHRDWLGQALRIGSRRRARGPVTEQVLDPALGQLPLLTSWKGDGGAFVTLPLVYTEHPETGVHNLGMYRVQRHDDRTTGIHWQIGKGGGFHHHAAEARGEALPVTVFVGGPPALILAAIAPLPENVPELLLASLLLGDRLELCQNPAGPHPLVAHAEVAIVGRVPPGVRRPEGPFGDHYGYWSLQHPYPVIEVERVCSRRDAIWPATVVGKPRQEDFFIGEYLSGLLAPLFPLVMPGVRSLWTYGETGFHALAAAVVHERHHREAMQHAFRILGEGQLALSKFLLLLDEPRDLHDFRGTLAHVLARFRPETDLYVFANLSMDTLDYTGPAVNEGSRGVMLGLGPAVREPARAWSGPLPCATAVEVYCPGCLVVQADDVAQVVRAMAGRGDDWPLIVVVDDAPATVASDTRFLWTVFTRFEPAADIHAEARVHRNHLVRSGPVVIDARMKPTYPGELSCDPDTAALVDRRWAEYFPGGGVEMGETW